MVSLWIKCLKISLNPNTYVKDQFYFSLLILMWEEGKSPPSVQCWSLFARSLFHLYHCELTCFWKLPLQKYLRVGGRSVRRDSLTKHPDPGRAFSLPSFVACLSVCPFLALSLFRFSKIGTILPGKDFILNQQSQYPMEKIQVRSASCGVLYISVSPCEHFLFHFGAWPHVTFIVQLVLQ